jgi:hypothetical protein
VKGAPVEIAAGDRVGVVERHHQVANGRDLARGQAGAEGFPGSAVGADVRVDDAVVGADAEDVAVELKVVLGAGDDFIALGLEQNRDRGVAALNGGDGK